MIITVVVLNTTTESEVESSVDTRKTHYYKQIFINNSQLSLHWKAALALSEVFEWPPIFPLVA